MKDFAKGLLSMLPLWFLTAAAPTPSSMLAMRALPDNVTEVSARSPIHGEIVIRQRTAHFTIHISWAEVFRIDEIRGLVQAVHHDSSTGRSADDLVPDIYTIDSGHGSTFYLTMGKLSMTWQDLNQLSMNLVSLLPEQPQPEGTLMVGFRENILDIQENDLLGWFAIGLTPLDD